MAEEEAREHRPAERAEHLVQRLGERQLEGHFSGRQSVQVPNTIPPNFVGLYYVNQPPALLRHALTQPLDRVIYSRLAPRKPDFDMVRDLMIETGVLDRRIPFHEYVDVRFADRASIQTAWKYEPGSGRAQ